jgi:hypothetical protein
MTTSVLTYRVGNENDPGDPWGRSRLVIQPDGSARLDHVFSRIRKAGAWTGRVDATALEALWSALRQAGFPAAPTTLLITGASPRQLTVEADGVSQYATIGYHEASSLPGYAEAFDLLDAVCRQLSGDAVPYPTKQPAIVHDAAEAPST